MSQVSGKIDTIHSVSLIERGDTCLQKHRKLFEGEYEILVEKLDNYYLITSAAIKNKSQARLTGVEFLMSNSACKASTNATNNTAQ